MDEREEMEHVPWADLLEETDPEDRRRRALTTGAALLAALVLGIVVSRAWWAAPSAPVPLAPATTVDVADSSDVSLPDIPELPLYSEADLMADPYDPNVLAAVTRAEWFVTDYFTADLEPSGSTDIRAALPVEVLAELPQDEIGSISYVEWAKAYRVEEAGDGTYIVSVVFRALGAPPDRGFTRQQVRAVEVPVAVGPGGGATILDLPSPAALPASPEPGDRVGEAGVPPQGVIDVVTARASLWGSEPRIVSTHHLDGTWRVVVTVTDAVGARWPMVLRIDEPA